MPLFNPLGICCDVCCCMGCEDSRRGRGDNKDATALAITLLIMFVGIALISALMHLYAHVVLGVCIAPN